MKAHLIAAGCFVGALLFVPLLAADEPKDEKEQSINEISLEVQVLRSFNSLKLDDDQLKLAAKMAKDTAEPVRKRTTGKVGEEYRKLLTNLRDALASADDDDKIGNLEDELDQITEKEKPELDDWYEITKAARKHAPEIIKSMTVPQLAGFYAAVADDVHEPLQLLTSAIEEVRGLEKKEWLEKRDGVADEVAWAVAGLDAAKGEKINDKVVALLSKVHSLTADEFKAKRAALEKEAKIIVGEVGPDTLLRHTCEKTVADMLSNPRLEAAVKARMK